MNCSAPLPGLAQRDTQTFLLLRRPNIVRYRPHLDVPSHYRFLLGSTPPGAHANTRPDPLDSFRPKERPGLSTVCPEACRNTEMKEATLRATNPT